MKYRKKPVVIEAFQWLGFDANDQLPEAWAEFHCEPCPDNEDALLIRTLEGDMRADFGDWIIKGVKGEVYPCKPDIFKATYEVVE